MHDIVLHNDMPVVLMNACSLVMSADACSHRRVTRCLTGFHNSVAFYASNDREIAHPVGGYIDRYICKGAQECAAQGRVFPSR